MSFAISNNTGQASPSRRGPGQITHIDRDQLLIENIAITYEVSRYALKEWFELFPVSDQVIEDAVDKMTGLEDYEYDEDLIRSTFYQYKAESQMASATE